jgi:hypothetical protein
MSHSRQGHYNRFPLQKEPADRIYINNLYYTHTLFYMTSRITNSLTPFRVTADRAALAAISICRGLTLLSSEDYHMFINISI